MTEMTEEPHEEASKMTWKGGITIPRSFRTYLGLEAGDLVVFKVIDGMVCLTRGTGPQLRAHQRISKGTP